MFATAFFVIGTGLAIYAILIGAIVLVRLAPFILAALAVPIILCLAWQGGWITAAIGAVVIAAGLVITIIRRVRDQRFRAAFRREWDERAAKRAADHAAWLAKFGGRTKP
jgi:membrane protein implicated in regulation of membrane protease activity